MQQWACVQITIGRKILWEKSIQVSGSIAFDTILQFQGNFKENLVYDSDML